MATVPNPKLGAAVLGVPKVNPGAEEVAPNKPPPRVVVVDVPNDKPVAVVAVLPNGNVGAAVVAPNPNDSPVAGTDVVTAAAG